MSDPVVMLDLLERRMEDRWQALARAYWNMPAPMVERLFTAYLDALEAYSKAKKQAQEQAKII